MDMNLRKEYLSALNEKNMIVSAANKRINELENQVNKLMKEVVELREQLSLHTEGMKYTNKKERTNEIS